MKQCKTIKWLFLQAMLLLFTFSGCSLETSRNGNLDGMWRLQSIDTIATGGRNNLDAQQLYWCFQADLMSLRYVSSAKNETFLMRFSYDGDRLVLSEPHVSDRAKDDPPVTNINMLSPFGVNGMTETFRVVELNSSRMKLSTNQLILNFRKF